MIPLTVPEIERLPVAPTTRPPPPPVVIHWDAWTRRHQARARWFHKRAQARPRRGDCGCPTSRTNSARTDTRLRFLAAQLGPYKSNAQVADFLDAYGDVVCSIN